MQPHPSPAPRRWGFAPVAAAVASVLLGGCAGELPAYEAAAPSPAPTASAPAGVDADRPSPVPVTRQGRYTLVELGAEAGQRDLLMQVINVTQPSAEGATVQDGLQYLLRQSGYRLCPPDADSSTLYALPLPAAHVRLGPITLRDALQTMAGDAWALSVDDTARMVCFHRSGASAAAIEPAWLPKEKQPW
ncbi:PilL N-terminal domain-containing protein [Xanthomonas sontii]|uniref:PFGI-1 class ICE element type IV pilus protein PilL2 n=1 Tax=Xanthomonas sontii TaxID=2650745 RepID=UPI0011E46289|nr:PilL N-terminal domain-containing protein [Xanthomonas sontii]TYD33921.1 pilus assembly protein PilL [Xanthomonas sontii]